ncbi:MAG: exodeoxyribonuclease III [Betaproteobacteria bacterium]|nr:exodeoxyribonuclease III [Betaproteobacteria bacterium]
MKLAAWNVNSIKVRLPHLLDWLAAGKTDAPDILCLQETKCEDANFPRDPIEAAGYRLAFAGQKTYNGVALLARQDLRDVVVGNPLFPEDEALRQQRLISATVGAGDAETRVICAYVPNGQSVGSDKYAYKLAWLEALAAWLEAELRVHPRLAIAGDFNIAPEDRDVYNPAAWAGQVLCSEPERAAFRRLLDLGLSDSFRLFPQPEASFSWWDYRMFAFQKNRGLRIDHVLLSQPLAERCAAAGIARPLRALERPSDHAPVWTEWRDE